MKTILRIGLRELLRTKWRATLLALILALQVSILGGGFLSVDSVFHTRDVYYADLALADLDVQFVPATVDEMPTKEALLRVPGVRAVERRFLSSGIMMSKAGEPYPVLVVYEDADHRPTVDDIRVLRGSALDPARPGDAIVDRAFAESYGIEPGADLVVNPNRFAAKLHVVGVGLSPEFLIATANQDILIPAKGSLGVIYASHKSLDQLFSDPLYNNLVVRYEPGADPDATQARVLAVLGKLDLERVTPKSSQFGYRFVEEIWGGSKIFSPVAASVLALMAAIIALITVNRVITQRRREIGALVAMGYSRKHFLIGLSPLGLAPGITGGALGIFGAMGYAQMLTRVDCERVGFPPALMDYAPSTLAWAASSAVIVGLISALIPIFKLLRMRPAEAIRGGGEIHFEGMPRVLEHLVSGLSTAARFGVRNVFRQRRLSIATLAIVSLAIGMPAAFLTAVSSWTAWIQEETNRMPWDVTASFRVPVDEQTASSVLANIAGVGSYEGYVQGSGMVHRSGAPSESMRIRGLPVPQKLQGVQVAEGGGFTSPDADEIILNRGFSRGARPPRVGETVTLEVRGASHPLRVVGVTNDMTLLTAYVPIETGRRILDKKGKTSGVYVKFDARIPAKAASAPSLARPIGKALGDDVTSVDVIDDADESARAPAPSSAALVQSADALRQALLDQELVTSAQTREQATGALVTFVDSARRNVRSFVGMGVALAFLSLLGILGFLVLERQSDYATLRAMGYGARQITSDIAIEVSLLALGGLVCALPMWCLLASILRGMMALAWFSVPIDFRASDFIGVAAPTLLFLAIVTIPAILQVLRFDITSALRGARGIG